MPSDARGPIPRETVRDLLGITRALYRSERVTDMPLVEARCSKLAEIGKQYRLALKLSASTKDNRAAWRWVAQATAALERFVASSSEVGLMVSATAANLGQQLPQRGRQ